MNYCMPQCWILYAAQVSCFDEWHCQNLHNGIKTYGQILSVFGGMLTDNKNPWGKNQNACMYHFLFS
jgi:hypothetical protein